MFKNNHLVVFSYVKYKVMGGIEMEVAYMYFISYYEDGKLSLVEEKWW